MKFMFKSFLLFFSLLTNQLYSIGSFTVGDPSQDTDVKLQDLPRYIRQTCQAQAQDLEEEVAKFKYGPEKDFILVPHTTLPDVILKIDHIAEDDRNNDFFLTKLRTDLESSLQALKNPEHFTINKAGQFNFAFVATEPKSLIVFYVQMASDLSLNYMKLAHLRQQLQSFPKDYPETAKAITYELYKARNRLDYTLANIIHAMRPHILEFKKSITEPVIHEKLSHIEQGLTKISRAEKQDLIKTVALARKAFAHPEVQKAWKASQK